MSIKEKIDNLIKDKELNITIEEIHIVGSSLLGRENPTDTDYVAIATNLYKSTKKHWIRHLIDGEDIVIVDKDSEKRRLELNPFEDDLEGKILYNYNYIIHKTVWGETDLVFDMIGKKEQYLNMVKKAYNESIGVMRNKYGISKVYSHYYIIFKMYDTNIFEITDEIKNNMNILYNQLEGYKDIIDWVLMKLKEE